MLQPQVGAALQPQVGAMLQPQVGAAQQVLAHPQLDPHRAKSMSSKPLREWQHDPHEVAHPLSQLPAAE